jgi:hypothetical protein
VVRGGRLGERHDRLPFLSEDLFGTFELAAIRVLRGSQPAAGCHAGEHAPRETPSCAHAERIDALMICGLAKNAKNAKSAKNGRPLARDIERLLASFAFDIISASIAGMPPIRAVSTRELSPAVTRMLSDLKHARGTATGMPSGGKQAARDIAARLQPGRKQAAHDQEPLAARLPLDRKAAPEAAAKLPLDRKAAPEAAAKLPLDRKAAPEAAARMPPGRKQAAREDKC